MTSTEQKQRLEAIAVKMKKAKGEELDALVAEIDRLIGFDTGDDRQDSERDANWQMKQHGDQS